MRIIAAILVAASAAVVISCSGAGSGPNAPLPVPPVADKAKAPADETKWADASAGETLTVGGITVGINDSAIGRVQLVSLGSLAESTEEHLVVRVVLSTRDPARRANYDSWAESIFGAPKLIDDIGNVYKLVSFGFGTEAIGHVKSASIYADTPATDILVFNRPVEAAKELRLELPASAFGQNGRLRFKFERPTPLSKTPVRRDPTEPKSEAKTAPVPDEPAPEPPKLDPEARAASKLRFARDLIAAKKYDRARERLNELIREFPSTKAAGEAKAELDKLPR